MAVKLYPYMDITNTACCLVKRQEGGRSQVQGATTPRNAKVEE